MKRFFLFAIVIAMTVCLCAGCASVNKVQLGVVNGYGSNVSGEGIGGIPEGNGANSGMTDNDNDNDTDIGDIGNTGDIGDTGNEGNTGDTGNEGNTGDTGNEGNTGDTGNEGNTGDTGNEGNTGDTGNEGEGEDEPAAIDPEAEGSGYHKIISYNLKAMYYDYKTTNTVDQREGVANYLKEHNASIIGLQEIDYNNPRSFSYDQMKYLSEQLGYEYFYCDAMDYEDGHKYGTGILSKYPIKESKKVYYQHQDPGTSEKRAYSRSVIAFPEGDLVFYNTHLRTGTSEDVNGGAAQQMREVLRAMYNEKLPAVLTADYNIVLEVRSQIADHSKVTQLNGGKDQTFFTEGLPIDDIYIRNLDYYTDESNGLSIFKDEHDVAPWSDHIPCWGYFKFKS